MDALLLTAALALACPDVDIGDVYRFPPLVAVAEHRAFCWEYVCHCREQALLDPSRGREWQLLDWEADRLDDPWWHLGLAWRSDDDESRRIWLRALRRDLGPAAYSCGRMTPPFPVWRFRPVD